MDLIKKIQSQLESLYGIKIGEQANEYLIGHDELSALLPMNQKTVIPKELFLVNPEPEQDTIEVALFLDPELRNNLKKHNPMHKICQNNISDFCTLIEGVSHFVYYVHKASLEFEITELEMELQAEIDKFLLIALLTQCDHKEQILELLFEDYYLQEELSSIQIERYQTANSLARKYCFELSKRLKQNNLPALFQEIRRFYPLTQEQKIRHILQ